MARDRYVHMSLAAPTPSARKPPAKSEPFRSVYLQMFMSDEQFADLILALALVAGPTAAIELEQIATELRQRAASAGAEGATRGSL